MAVYLTSDLHLGHAKVAELRGFETTTAHDDAIIGNAVKALPHGTQLFVLGDLAFGAQTMKHLLIKKFVWTMTDIGVLVHFIYGNHDRPHPTNRNGALYSLGEHGHCSEALHGSIRHDGTEYLLSHHPYDGDSGDHEDRDVQWRLRDLGAPLLHGHVHSSQQLTHSRLGTPQIHVGLDAWNLTPVALSEAVQLIA